MFTHRSTTPSALAMDSPTVINIMRNMRGNQKIPLEEVHRRYPTITKLYTGRPEMLVMRMTNGRNIQMFRGGVVQLLGGMTDAKAEDMLHELLSKLQQIDIMQHFQVSTWTVTNLVMSVQLKTALCLHRIKSTKADVFYEVEIFPASLIDKWHPVHVAAFNTGRIILTGLKSFDHFYNVLSDLTAFLEDCNVL